MNIDVPDVEAAIAFYPSAFDLGVGRRFDSSFIELLGAETKVYLLENIAGSTIGPAGGDVRRYDRHWTPVHPDIVWEDIALATEKVIRAGATQEGETREAPYGKLTMFADPFGHGFCLIEFNSQGYDALKR